MIIDLDEYRQEVEAKQRDIAKLLLQVKFDKKAIFEIAKLQFELEEMARKVFGDPINKPEGEEL